MISRRKVESDQPIATPERQLPEAGMKQNEEGGYDRDHDADEFQSLCS